MLHHVATHAYVLFDRPGLGADLLPAVRGLQVHGLLILVVPVEVGQSPHARVRCPRHRRLSRGATKAALCNFFFMALQRYS